jgi:hypothetical protein
MLSGPIVNMWFADRDFYLLYSLPPFALSNDTFDAVHGAVGTGHLAVGRDVVPLHHIASDFAGAAGSAGLGGPALDRLGIAIGIELGGTTRALLRGGRR